jgi:hypothetical protein
MPVAVQMTIIQIYFIQAVDKVTVQMVRIICSEYLEYFKLLNYFVCVKNLVISYCIIIISRVMDVTVVR